MISWTAKPLACKLPSTSSTVPHDLKLEVAQLKLPDLEGWSFRPQLVLIFHDAYSNLFACTVWQAAKQAAVQRQASN